LRIRNSEYTSIQSSESRIPISEFNPAYHSFANVREQHLISQN
jgi:hypothetical protein